MVYLTTCWISHWCLLFTADCHMTWAMNVTLQNDQMLGIFGFAFVSFWIFISSPRVWPLGWRTTPQRWFLTIVYKDSPRFLHPWFTVASNSELFACGLPTVGFPKSWAKRQTLYLSSVVRQRIWGLEIVCQKLRYFDDKNGLATKQKRKSTPMNIWYFKGCI